MFFPFVGALVILLIYLGCILFFIIAIYKLSFTYKRINKIVYSCNSYVFYFYLLTFIYILSNMERERKKNRKAPTERNIMG